MEKKTTDVLVVGGGGAGLRAALAASQKSAAVILATRGELESSSVTAVACSDRMAFHATLAHTEPGGSGNWAHHAEDIFEIGGRVSDPALAEILAKDSARAYTYLDALGVPWVREQDGRAKQFLTDGSTYARACYTGPYTANHIHQALREELRKHPVELVEDCMIVDLVLDATASRVIGAIGFNENTEEAIVIACGAVVLATGGAGRAFERSVFPDGMTGDGYAIALRAGAELVNMEFIQFGLCSVATNLACSGSMMRAMPRIVDGSDADLLEKLEEQGLSQSEVLSLLFHKGASWPVSVEHPSHKIDVLVAHAKREGANVYLDYSSNPRQLERGKLPGSVSDWYSKTCKRTDLEDSSPLDRLRSINPEAMEWLKERGVDVGGGDRVEIEPMVQHFQGGVRIGRQANTSVRGLYAAGECAGGQHGANRPGGSALLDGQVFGRISGVEASRFAQSVDRIELDDSGISSALKRLRNLTAFAETRPGRRLSAPMPQILQQACGVIRTGTGLQKALMALNGTPDDATDDKGPLLLDSLEKRNIKIVARAIVKAALLREESRGPHLRFSDDDTWTPLPSLPDLAGQMTCVKKGEATDGLACTWSRLK